MHSQSDKHFTLCRLPKCRRRSNINGQLFVSSHLREGSFDKFRGHTCHGIETKSKKFSSLMRKRVKANNNNANVERFDTRARTRSLAVQMIRNDTNHIFMMFSLSIRIYFFLFLRLIFYDTLNVSAFHLDRFFFVSFRFVSSPRKFFFILLS